uniref:Uncharacterized protein n=1 Tax=Cannabis sativa TaxID=3483 RepID=A0A803QK47_CANSA
MVRTPCCDQNGMKKGTWTPEEDRKLVAYVTRYGCWNWRQLPKFAGLKRCGKSCRLRWMNYLRPNVKRGNYTHEEEETITRLHASLGNNPRARAGDSSYPQEVTSRQKSRRDEDQNRDDPIIEDAKPGESSYEDAEEKSQSDDKMTKMEVVTTALTKLSPDVLAPPTTDAPEKSNPKDPETLGVHKDKGKESLRKNQRKLLLQNSLKSLKLLTNLNRRGKETTSKGTVTKPILEAESRRNTR